MSDERMQNPSEPLVSINLAVSDDKRSAEVTRNGAASKDAPRNADASKNGATAPHNRNEKADKEQGSEAKGQDAKGADAKGSDTEQVSIAKLRQKSRLPALDDDTDVGVEKEHIVTRDGKADLLFSGVLLASAASATAPKGEWQEYRIYQTDGSKHVFSKVTRNVLEEEDDAWEADVFDPAPSSVPSQLIRGAREIARARPLTWMDAAVAFFGYDPLAKVLYRKLSVRFEEQIS